VLRANAVQRNLTKFMKLYTSHLQTVGATRVTWNKDQTENRQVDATVQNLVSRVAWRLECVPQVSFSRSFSKRTLISSVRLADASSLVNPLNLQVQVHAIPVPNSPT
jgi:hypothetical protein